MPAARTCWRAICLPDSTLSATPNVTARAAWATSADEEFGKLALDRQLELEAHARRGGLSSAGTASVAHSPWPASMH